jgi:signal transduction histidine kinase
MTRQSSSHSGDLTVVRRAGRIVAIQASLALAGMLLLVGAVVAIAFSREQSHQITEQLTTVAMSADDVDDPPPGMELAMRSAGGSVMASDGGKVALPLLSGPTGFSDLNDKGRQYRALTVDRPEGRVVAITDLAPYRTSQARLFGALALAELTGILAAVAVVVLFTRRSVRPLAQALALQRRFVADASHELRAPLTVLHTRAQLLASRLHSGDVSAATRDADAMVADTRVLSGLVDDLLASATMTTGSTGGERVDLASVSHAVCTSMGPHAESVGVTLVCDIRDPGALEVIGTEAALRRALTALVDNAIGHQNEGGRVELVASRDGQQVIVSVADNGVGIDDATMATLFNRFTHGSAHTNRDGRPSYGIGLALVREIVGAHDGEISVASSPGRGATFTVALPAAPSPR